ncbi:MAG: putative metal-dependent hydrolase [Bacteroidetes bacterium]|nr:putative metal-dependent hydrolase [Bacteroidota bacterium]
METDEFLRYPIGGDQSSLHNKAYFTAEKKSELLWELKMLPAELEYALLNLDANQLATPYRPGGWSVNQLVHHVADSHMQAYTRFKLGFTEHNPEIKPYDQDAWASLSDNQLPVNFSLTLLHALHARWWFFADKFTEVDWEKTIFHPEKQRSIPLRELLDTYVWHGKHHTAQITQLRKRNKW